MVAAVDIKIEKIEVSKLLELSLENLPFGRYFTDHMLEADYINGEWTNITIKPYQALSFDPALSVLHYGQSIFEGIKAYKTEDGEAFIFRPFDNLIRFNTSAERMCMPTVPEELFIEGMRQLIEIDKDWIPNKKDHSLYIRPFMFSTDAFLGVRPSDTYKFMVILSPSGPYFAAPMKILVEENYTRAAPGGVGFSKNAGNYGGSLIAARIANKMGYDQVLWTDAFEHKWLQEVGMMNVVFIINGVAVTPSLEEGTILKGVTRDSVLTLLKKRGFKVEERKISIDELLVAYHAGQVQEVFGTGTAATIAPIRELKYKDNIMQFDTTKWTIAPAIKQDMDEIKSCAVADEFGWMFPI
jgi:branched-chain amino acid aminotransferase